MAREIELCVALIAELKFGSPVYVQSLLVHTKPDFLVLGVVITGTFPGTHNAVYEVPDTIIILGH